MTSSRRPPRTGVRPTTRRNLQPVEDLRPVGADGSRPPMLDFHLRRKLKILGLANALPLVAIGGLFFGWSMNMVEFSIDGHRLLFTFLIILCAMVLVASCWWVLFPFSVWLRAYPLWYYHHESKAIWALPTAAAWITWFVLWVACVTLTLFAIYLIGYAVIDLLGRLGGSA